MVSEVNHASPDNGLWLSFSDSSPMFWKAIAVWNYPIAWKLRPFTCAKSANETLTIHNSCFAFVSKWNHHPSDISFSLHVRHKCFWWIISEWLWCHLGHVLPHIFSFLWLTIETSGTCQITCICGQLHKGSQTLSVEYNCITMGDVIKKKVSFSMRVKYRLSTLYGSKLKWNSFINSHGSFVPVHWSVPGALHVLLWFSIDLDCKWLQVTQD